MTFDQISDQLSNHLFESTEFSSINFKLGADDSLVETGLLDSLGILTLIGFLEDNYSIEFEEEDIDADTFSSVGSIARVVLKYLK